MELKVKFLGWSAGLPVAMLHKETAEKAGVHTQGRILIKTISEGKVRIEYNTRNPSTTNG